MVERLRSSFSKLWDRWNGLERKNKIRIITITVLLIMAMVLMVYLALRPQKVPLFNNLDYPTMVSIQEKLLADKGIQTWITNSGTLQVDVKNVNAGRAYVETEGLLSSKEFTYADALNYSTMSTTETIKNENLKQAKQTELGAMLRLFKGVSGASVKLYIPNTTSYFIDMGEAKESTAMVLLTINSQFDKGQGENIARAVSRSVVNLKMENIEILDQYANIIFSGMSQVGGSSSALTQIEAKERYEARLAQSIRAMLALYASQIQCFGNIVLDWTNTSEHMTILSSPTGADAAQGVVTSEQTENTKASGVTPNAAPGMDSNNAQSGTYQTGNSEQSSASSNSATRNYAYNVTETTKDGAVGVLVPEASSFSIILYDENILEEDFLTRNNMLGGLTWEQFKNQNDGKKTLRTDIDDQLISLIQNGLGINNVQLIGYTVNVCVDKVVKPLAIEQIVMFSILALLILLLAMALLRVTKPDEISIAEPELTVKDLLISTQIEEAQEAEQAESQKLAAIALQQESQTKQQIDKFVDEKPELVAQLMRNWLNDDWD